MTDALSRKGKCQGNTPVEPRGFKEMVALRAMNVEIAYEDEGKLLATLKVKPIWLNQIVEAQDMDPSFHKIKG